MTLIDKSWIAIFLSVFTAARQVYKEIKGKKGQLIFHYDEEWICNDGGGYELWMMVSIVNLSDQKRLIRKIQIEKFISKRQQIIVDDTETVYPLKLENGEQYKYKLFSLNNSNVVLGFDYSDLNNDSIPDNEKVFTTLVYTPVKLRIVVSDTTGKSYTSKWVFIEKHDETALGDKIHYMEGREKRLTVFFY